MPSQSPGAWFAFTVTAGAAVAVIAAACSTGADGVSACQSIETARCQVAPSCPANFDLTSPLPDGNDVTACIRFYKDQCLHGLVTTVVPSSIAVNECVSAILSAGKTASAAHSQGDDAAAPCGTIVNPQNDPACEFLNGVDAGEDGGPCVGSTQCAGSTTGAVDCCATVVLEPPPDGGVFPNCGVSSVTSYCGICIGSTIGPTCSNTESVHLCSLASDCAGDTNNPLCCQLPGYEACVSSILVAVGSLTCL
jgi:hypothetical protein